MSLPTTWKTATLAELTAETRPICYGVLKPGDYDPSGTPLLRIVDLKDDRVALEGLHYISRDLDEEFARSRLRGGEVLLSIQGTIGRTAIVPESLAGANISRTLAVIDPDPGLMTPAFLYYIFQWLRDTNAYETQGATRASLNIGTIRKIRVPVPPREEQDRIVERLGRLQDQLGSAKRFLGETAELRDALRLSALRTVFSVSASRKTLGEIAETQLGKMLSAKARSVGPGARPYLRNKNVQWGEIDTDDLLEMEFSEKELEKFRLRPGDLMVCEGGEVGRAAIWDGRVEDIAFQKALHRIRPNAEVSSSWLFHYFRWLGQSNGFAGHITGSAIPHLPQEDLRRISVPVPDRPTQDRLVADLDRLEASTEELSAALELAGGQIEALWTASLTAAFKATLIRSATGEGTPEGAADSKNPSLAPSVA